MANTGRLLGHHALLTGTGGGIGLAVLAAYLAEGAICTAIDLADTPGEAIEALLKAHRSQLDYVAADVADAACVRAVIAKATEKRGPISRLFNNAAIFDLAPVTEASVESFDRVFGVNVKGMFFTMQAVLRQMIEHDVKGAIVNVASQAGRRGEPLVAHYCASKAAVISYTQSAGLAMAPHGIRVNAIAPGITDTPMWRTVDQLYAQSMGLPVGEPTQRFIGAVPMGRMGQPHDLAGAAVFLASDDAAFITCQTLNVDGGTVMS
ncbi:L-iditol 2-dehydrogenase [Shinella sp. CPCC 101442]|uniref:L-iditol 2-dehydrogenase n=1 Tax=Shinella sp. CPCC 101442 TaxID=2932265 RepID=UPI002152ECCD|nr:L-iditol 2-dehydrogenase [Shinella sp. CPCC 101442]MCR6497408.1 L-iditol 2-dehydrogenase [Shinella sp. CPCC 101442]